MIQHFDFKPRIVYLITLHFSRSLPKSASFDDSQTALDVVRNKRAKQMSTEKVPRQSSHSSQAPSTSRTTKSGLSQERTVGCADIVADKV